MKTIAELNDSNFDEALAATKTPVLVDFYAPWCGPCKMLAPLLAQLARHFAGRIQFFQVNVDAAPELAARYEITGVPTLLFVRDGAVCDRVVGFAAPRALAHKLEALAGPAEVRA
jgi:thioredoxin 1